MNDDARRIVGIVGVGLLGGAIAERLLRAGFRVHGYDVAESRRRALTALGGTAVSSVADLGKLSRIVLSLPDANASQQVAGEFERDPRSVRVVIDTTTGDPQQMQAIAARLAAKNIAYLDATVGGSSEQCRQGDVVVMAGGDQTAFERCRDLFDAFARRSFHVGPVGSGARMKLVFNLVLGLNRAALAEGLSLAGRLGIDAARALQVLQSGAAYSKAMDVKGEKMLAGDFAPQARLAQHLKDVRLVLEAGQRAGALLPLSELHERLLRSLVDVGLGEADNSAIIRAYDAAAGGNRH